jgi:hypothetical protein
MLLLVMLLLILKLSWYQSHGSNSVQRQQIMEHDITVLFDKHITSAFELRYCTNVIVMIDNIIIMIMRKKKKCKARSHCQKIWEQKKIINRRLNSNVVRDKKNCVGRCM